MHSPVPRLELDALPADLRDALQPRVLRLGYLGEFFKCAGHQPAVLRAFMTFTDELKAALPDNLTEVVALTVAVATGNAYERHQHERLSRKLGFSDDWVRALIEGRPDPLNDAERGVQALTQRVLEDRGHGASNEFAAVAAALGAAPAMAILFLVGRYVSHSLIVNTLQLAPPVASIFSEPEP